jgi:hypothetical protein
MSRDRSRSPGARERAAAEREAAEAEAAAEEIGVLTNFYSTESEENNVKRAWTARNGTLQSSCGTEFAKHISHAIPDSRLEQRGTDYYINFTINGRPTHISFHQNPGFPSTAGAFHIKFNDDTLTVRLVLKRRPLDNVLQFYPVVSSGILTRALNNEISRIINDINDILSRYVFTGDPANGCGGGGRAYILNEGSFPPLGKKPRWGGGTRKNRSRRRRTPKNNRR